MIHVIIDRSDLIPRCSACGMPIPKSIDDVILTLSRWEMVCTNCKEVAMEVRYTCKEAEEN